MKIKNLTRFNLSENHINSVTSKAIELYNTSLPLYYCNYQRKIRAYGKLNNYNCNTIHNACQIAQSNYIFQVLPVGTEFKIVFIPLEQESNKIDLVLNVSLDYNNLRDTKHVVVIDTN